MDEPAVRLVLGPAAVAAVAELLRRVEELERRLDALAPPPRPRRDRPAGDWHPRLGDRDG